MFGITSNIVMVLSKFAFKINSITFYNIAYVIFWVLCAISFILMLVVPRWNNKSSKKNLSDQEEGKIIFSGELSYECKNIC
jgi:hypothetical protein